MGSNFQTLKPLQVTSFSPSYDKDEYANTAWTVNGKIGDFSLIYTGGWTLRNVNQQMEYSNYSRTYYGVYYSCSGGTSSYSQIDPGGPLKCNSPVTSWHDSIKNTISARSCASARRAIGALWDRRRLLRTVSHLRQYELQLPDGSELHGTVARQPRSPASRLPRFGRALSRRARRDSAGDGERSHPRSDATAFGEDVQRGYDQTAFFGSVDFDVIPNVLTVSGGTRWFQYQEFELGSVYTTNVHCENVLICYDNPVFAAKAYPKRDIDAHNDHVTFSGFKSRFNLIWNVDDDIMAYYTYSEGFRPGGFNRYNVNLVLKDPSGNPQYNTPNSFSPDSLTNQEIGVKSQWFDHNLLLNLSLYDMDWSNVQFLFFQPLYTGNVTFATNGPSYNIKGAELQFVGRPMDGLTFDGSATYNDNTKSKSPCLISNVPASPTFGKCITVTNLGPYPNPYGVVGRPGGIFTEMAGQYPRTL